MQEMGALCVFMPWGGETCGNANWMEKVFHSSALGWGPACSPWSYYQAPSQLHIQSFPYDASNRRLKEGRITQVTTASGREQDPGQVPLLDERDSWEVGKLGR